MRVLVTVFPVTLEVSLSLSLRRRFFDMLVPEELRLLEAAAEEEWCTRVVWEWPEPEVRDTVTFVGGGLGDRRSLGKDGGRGYRQGE